MTTQSVEQLNKDFSFNKNNQSISFRIGKGDIPVAEIKNTQASAVVSLQGAQILSWIPVGEGEVIWVSEDAKFAPGKSVRGGVPVCWPWFGAHVSNSSLPAHGFARTVLWKVEKTDALPTGETLIVFSLDTTGNDMWPEPTHAEMRITVGKVLKIELVTTNNSSKPITIGQALHTYFSVDDVSKTTVTGLEDKEYLDKPDGFKRKTQTGPVTFSCEVDRIYLNTPDDAVIDDKKRKIIIRKQGSHSTVVWNPWQAVAEKMGDLGKDGYLKMLCVESANAAEDTVEIDAGKQHTMFVTYEIGH